MINFEKLVGCPLVYANDPKKVRLRKYVRATRSYLEENDLENVNKYLTKIEELYNANN